MPDFAAWFAMAMSAVLWWAGLEKLRYVRSMVGTMHELGVPTWAAKQLAVGVGVAEIGVAVGLLFRPDSVWTLGGVTVLAGAFAAAGLVAMGRDKPIRCSCFGAGRGDLGELQVIALLPWLSGVWILGTSAEAPLSFSTGAIRFAIVALAIAVVRTVAVVRAWREARGDRLAAVEMFQ
jgi:hypothetical protein